MGQWLFNGNTNSRNIGKVLTNVIEDFLAAAERMWIQRGDNLSGIYALGMFIQFGPSRFSDEPFYVADFLEALLNDSSNFIRLLE